MPGTYTLAVASLATLTTELDALIFTPRANQVAVGQTVTTNFALTATDDQNASKSDAKTSVVATSINEAPSVPQPLSYSVTEGQTLDLYKLLASVADPDPGDQVTITAISPSVLGTPTAGFLHSDLAGGKLTYTADGYNPNAKQPVDTFSYTVTDNHGLSAQGMVNITVSPSGSLATTQVGTSGADTLTASKSGTRVIGGDGNDTLSANASGTLVFAGRGDDTVGVNAAKTVVYGGTGTNTINLGNTAQNSIVLQQGGRDEVYGFKLTNGSQLDLRHVLAESQLTLSDKSQLGTYFGVAASGRDATLSFNLNGTTSGAGSAFAVLHGVGANTTLATLVASNALTFN